MLDHLGSFAVGIQLDMVAMARWYPQVKRNASLM